MFLAMTVYQKTTLLIFLMNASIVFCIGSMYQPLKLIDFGCAMELNSGIEEELLKSVPGTPEYMAPEVCTCMYT